MDKTVLMPEALLPFDMYKNGHYCIIGWFAKHLCDLDVADQPDLEEEAFEAVKDVFELQMLISIWKPSSEAKTMEDRLAHFREVCKEYNIEIIYPVA